MSHTCWHGGLSLDFEPTGKVLSDLELPKPALQVAAFYARRRKVLENNLYLMAGTNIPAITPTPLEFCQWTIKADLEIPTGLLQAVSHTSGVPLSRRNLPSPTATNDPALDPRERTNLLLLVSLMAQKAYGFDPARERSDVANQIQSDLDRMGISLHVQTIRKYLKAAASILPKGAGDE